MSISRMWWDVWLTAWYFEQSDVVCVVCSLQVVCLREGDQKILGLHVVGPHAGEITQGFAVAVK